jgi:hypothetical protein
MDLTGQPQMRTPKAMINARFTIFIQENNPWPLEANGLGFEEGSAPGVTAFAGSGIPALIKDASS